MKIVHLLSQNHLTGAEVYAVTLANSQLNAKHQVFQVSNGFFFPTPAICHSLEVETKSKIVFYKNVLWFRNFLKKNEIQIIHTHSRAAAKLAYWARVGLNVGLVSTVHGQQHSSVSKKLFNQYGDFIIPVCENLSSHLIKDFGYEQTRIKVLPNGISDQQFFLQMKKNAGAVKKIAIIGRTTGPKQQRTEQVIQALSQVPGECEITLVGGKKSDLQLAADLLKSVHEIHVPSLTSLTYAQYDLVIGAGRVCMEALIAGVPTIAFGEAEYIGLIRPANFSQAIKSNFGDINLKSTGPVLNAEAFTNDLAVMVRWEETQILSVLASKEFSLANLSKKIMRLYESAFFLRNHPAWIPTLMYHKIPSVEIESQHRIFVTKENFEKHLKFFKIRGFTSLTFSELAKFRRGEKDFSLFPKKPLILTFDDGYRDNLENASPLLKKYGFRSQLFLLANSAIKDNQWDINSDEPAHEIISATERQQWLTSAFEIGSHGFSHKKITEMTDDEAFHELKASKDSLEKEFAITINTYAFTYGITSPKASAFAFDAGYDYAVNTDTGGLKLEEAPYQIFRVNMFPEESLFSLWKKTSTWYRKYYFNKRNK
ncbi:MAG: polysaccharide deacetylase family protein [Bdellovibrio sp.]|nr:polysaccharide deacetylase family protein [Bdellovibrio sp.]